MKEEVVSHSYRDFQQRYLGTFGWCEKPDGTSILVQVSKVTAEKVGFVDEKGGEYWALSDVGNVFSFLPVQRGLYYYDGSIIYLQRVPARQYKRGICLENTSVNDLTENFRRDVSHDLLQKVFGEQENPTLEKFKELPTRDVLLNNMFAIIRNIVYLYDNAIGTYNVGRITLSNKLFKQELDDVIRDTRLNLFVDVKT